MSATAIFGFIFDIFQLLISILDIGTDIAVAVEFYQQGQEHQNNSSTNFTNASAAVIDGANTTTTTPTTMGLTPGQAHVFFILVIVTLTITSIGNAVLFGNRSGLFRPDKCGTWIFPIVLAPVGLLLPPVNFILTKFCGWNPEDGSRAYHTDWGKAVEELEVREEASPVGEAAKAVFEEYKTGQMQQLSTLDRAVTERSIAYMNVNFQCFSESAPQLVIQLVAISISGSPTTLQVVSLCLCMLSIVSKAFFLCRSFCTRAFFAKICFFSFDIAASALLFSSLIASNIEKEHSLFGSSDVRVSKLSAPFFYLVVFGAVVWFFFLLGLYCYAMYRERQCKDRAMITGAALTGLVVLSGPVVICYSALRLGWLLLLSQMLQPYESDLPHGGLLHAWLHSGTGQKRRMLVDWGKTLKRCRRWAIAESTAFIDNYGFSQRRSLLEFSSFFDEWLKEKENEKRKQLVEQLDEPVYLARKIDAWRKKVKRDLFDDIYSERVIPAKASDDADMFVDDFKFRSMHAKLVVKLLSVARFRWLHDQHYEWGHILDGEARKKWNPPGWMGASSRKLFADLDPMPIIFRDIHDRLANLDESSSANSAEKKFPDGISLSDLFPISAIIRKSGGDWLGTVMILLFAMTGGTIAVYGAMFPFLLVAIHGWEVLQTMQKLCFILSCVTLFLSLLLLPSFVRYIGSSLVMKNLNSSLYLGGGLDTSLTSIGTTIINAFNSSSLSVLASVVGPQSVPEDATFLHVAPFLTSKMVGLWGAIKLEEEVAQGATAAVPVGLGDGDAGDDDDEESRIIGSGAAAAGAAGGGGGTNDDERSTGYRRIDDD